MLAMIAVALIVVAVWGAVFFRHAGLLGGCLGVILLGSCFGHAYYHVHIGPLPLTTDRLLLGGLLAGYLLLRAGKHVDRKQLNHIDLLLIAFLVGLLVSTLTHDWRANNFQALASLVFFYVAPSTLYWIARESRVSQRVVLGCLAFLAAFGVYLAATSVFEQQQLEGLIFPRYIASEAHLEFLGRGRGPFLNPVGNGFFLCAGLFSLLMFWPRVNRSARVLLLLLALLYVAGIFCTLTRVVWLSASIGLLAIAVLNLPRRWGVAAGVGAVILAASVVAVKWDDLNAFKRDRHVSVAEMSQSATLRPVLAYLAWRIYLDHPLMGCGYRQYETIVGHYVSDRSTTLQLEQGRHYAQHNVFLALLAETGLVGVSLFVLFLTTLSQTAWRLWRASSTELASRQMGLFMLLMLGTYLTMGMFQDLALIPMVHMLLFFLAGLTRNLQEHGIPGRFFRTESESRIDRCEGARPHPDCIRAAGGCHGSDGDEGKERSWADARPPEDEMGSGDESSPAGDFRDDAFRDDAFRDDSANGHVSRDNGHDGYHGDREVPDGNRCGRVCRHGHRDHEAPPWRAWRLGPKWPRRQW